MPIWIGPVKERRTNYVSYHFRFFMKIWLGGKNISFDIQTKVFILFCYLFVIFTTEKNDRFSEKIHKLEMYWHHFIWLLYLVICHFGKKCSTLLKFLKWPHTAAMWRSVNPSLFLNFYLQYNIDIFKKLIFIIAMRSGVKPSLFLGFS